jgi:hypothetical protein
VGIGVDPASEVGAPVGESVATLWHPESATLNTANTANARTSFMR